MRLISIEDIKAYHPISNSAKVRIVQQYIQDAQIMDLKPLMGEKFYFDVLVNPNTPANKKLLEAASYTNVESGETFTYDNPGLKRVLSTFAYARYKLFGSNIDTPFGTVNKETQDGANVSFAGLKGEYKMLQQTATLYWEEVERFIIRNVNDYPLYRKDFCQPRRQFRFNKISKRTDEAQYREDYDRYR